jgi:hypothetical protein
MDNIQLKYNLLDAVSKKQVVDFIDKIISKKQNSKVEQSAYKKKILAVSTWSKTEVDLITENQSFIQFKAEEW